MIIDNNHIFSAARKCLITGLWNPNERVLNSRDIAGIRAVLSKDGNHSIYDGVRHHSVKAVTFVPSKEWADAVADDEALFDEALKAIKSWRGWPGVDVQTYRFVKYGGFTFRSCIDEFIKQRVPTAR